MKKLLALVLTLALLCGVLAGCDNAKTMLEKADAALLEAPYTVTLKMSFETDNEELNKVFSIMNMEIPVTVDGKNIAMDMNMDIMGITTEAKVIVADMMMYYDIQVMGQNVRMKATMNEEQYKEFMEDNNAQMTVNPEDFGELTVETKDGKKYIACGKISEEGLKELNGVIEDSIKALNAKATVSDVTYGVTLNGGKYESMDMTCVYSVTVGNETCTVTFKLGAEYTYDNVEKITAPADADKYQSVDYGELAK